MRKKGSKTLVFLSVDSSERLTAFGFTVQSLLCYAMLCYDYDSLHQNQPVDGHLSMASFSSYRSVLLRRQRPRDPAAKHARDGDETADAQRAHAADAVAARAPARHACAHDAGEAAQQRRGRSCAIRAQDRGERGKVRDEAGAQHDARGEDDGRVGGCRWWGGGVGFGGGGGGGRRRQRPE